MAGQQPDGDEVTSERSNTTNVEKTTLMVQNGSSAVWHVLLAAVVIVLILVLAMIVRWYYRKRKYNRLRHYLIPTYTFDPNEEETWDTGIDSQESAIFASAIPQGYQSMEAKNNVGEASNSSKRNP